ncbi:hypothetical protein [uncultured Chitinophaga sp.]|uniref:tetratricopeptide repeat protein n=1 Tax=uncultured Chitinophaga sp. TaxID=339340 RepID=UPI0025E6141C|nr:hypothetical protein [uncultured Chitinophaga sp.]
MNQSAQNPEALFRNGVALIEPYIFIAGNVSSDPAQKEIAIFRGIGMLDEVTELTPGNFAAFWIKGKAYQALQLQEKAYVEFVTAFELNDENPDVARELAITCGYLGKGQEAVTISLHALSLDHHNPGLMGNLALSYLLNGEVENAERTIAAALVHSPDDGINQVLQTIIAEVKSGQRQRPYKYEDLQ